MSKPPPTTPPLFPARSSACCSTPRRSSTARTVGTLGHHAFAFVDWLEQAGVTSGRSAAHPNGLHNSPYFSSSAFAGNPWLVDLERLGEAGLLRTPVLHREPRDDRVPFATLPQAKLPQLLTAARDLPALADHPWRPASRRSRARAWLEYTAHFFCLKARPWAVRPGGPGSRTCARAGPRRWPGAGRPWPTGSKVWEPLLFFFERQWQDVKAYANGKGIRILGDLPIYVHQDSADVWRYREQFRLDRKGHMVVQSGVPPDAFSAAGQLWATRSTAGSGCAGRLLVVARAPAPLHALSDIVRIDHFRPVRLLGGPRRRRRRSRRPVGSGAWSAVFRRARPALPPPCRSWPKTWGPWTRRFTRCATATTSSACASCSSASTACRTTPHRPDVFPEESIAYTGTHDNDTLAGWCLRWTERPGPRSPAITSRPGGPGRQGGLVAHRGGGPRAGRGSPRDPFPGPAGAGPASPHDDPARTIGNWDWRLPRTASATTSPVFGGSGPYRVT